ncbi:MAG: ATP-binding protein [Acidimicrobiia bacterium]
MGIPEGPSVEYKETLDLGSRSERREFLKDLTGMGNGGGGTVMYGIREGSGDYPVADEILPLSDWSLVGIAEDVVRAGTRPPLLMEQATIPMDTGYVLCIDVQPSPLGPYMVETYGDSRYYMRRGRSVEPMTEHDVRDAYALATRARDHRSDVWEGHGMPIVPATSDVPWVTVSAVPEEPVRDILDLAGVDPERLDLPGRVAGQLEAFGLGSSFLRLGRWSEGLFGEDGSEDRDPSAMLRLHRDGAIAIARALWSDISPILISRVVNAQLVLLAWLWERFGATRPSELCTRLENLQTVSLDIGGMFHDKRAIHMPRGIDLQYLEAREEVLPWDCGGRRNVIA